MRLTDHQREIWAVIVISVAALMSAWCAYQSARWGGAQTTAFARANSTRLESLRATTLASRQITIDVNLFTEYANAASTHNAALQHFLTQRFPDRLKVAMKAWLATKPLRNAAAPPSPFAMSEYRLSAQDDADRLEAKAGGFFDEGMRARETADRYILTTVLFASASFLAGVGSKFDLRPAAITALAVGTAVLLTAAVLLFSQPTR